MRLVRFSTRAMLIGFACVAIVLASLARPTEVTAWLATRGYYLAILAGPLGVIYRAGEARAFWIGFSIIGWGQIVLAHWIGTSWPRLFDVAARGLHQLYFSAPPMTLDLGAQWQSSGPFLTPNQLVDSEEFNQFLEITSASGATLLSLLGGALAVYLYRTGEQAGLTSRGDIG
jgi:hypothetical protein